jgi:N-acetylglutamate synthase-like GNAT family acetyltransferase
MSTPVEIAFLADVPHAAPQLAAWSYQAWHHFFPQLSEADLLAEYEASRNKDVLPLALVALDAGQVCGTALLLVQDGLPGYEHLSPWLASVYVAATHRRRGIGAQLVTGISQCARNIGIKTLYLWTDAESAWYAHMGWTAIAMTVFHEHQITVMQYKLDESES